MSARAFRLVLLCAVLAPAAALAHKPVVISAAEPFVLPNSGFSWALYGTFATGDEVFVVRMSQEQGRALPFQMLVPHRSELAEHRPVFAVVGPGLPAPTEAERALLPRALPAGAGAIVDLNDESPRTVELEQFTRRVFWSSTPIAWILPAGNLEIWIWVPRRTAGKFVLGFGVEEDFGEGDMSELLKNWSDYAY